MRNPDTLSGSLGRCFNPLHSQICVVIEPKAYYSVTRVKLMGVVWSYDMNVTLDLGCLDVKIMIVNFHSLRITVFDGVYSFRVVG